MLVSSVYDLPPEHKRVPGNVSEMFRVFPSRMLRTASTSAAVAGVVPIFVIAALSTEGVLLTADVTFTFFELFEFLFRSSSHCFAGAFGFSDLFTGMRLEDADFALLLGMPEEMHCSRSACSCSKEVRDSILSDDRDSWRERGRLNDSTKSGF